MTGRIRKLYFGYGSNMDEGQMSARCPGATLAGVAKLVGYRFIINLRGVATVVPRDSSEVHGVLWELTRRDEESLDGYEGVYEGFYYKEWLPVEADGCETRSALIYIAKESEPGGFRDGYVELIVAAAKRHRFPEDYIDELESWIRA